MSKSSLFVVLMICSFAVACSPAAKEPPASPAPSPKPEAAKPAVSPDEEIAVFDTSYGRFKMRFFEDLAPKHVAHFKKLVKEGFYDGLAFHRAIPKGIIQGGDPTTRGDDRSQWGAGLPGQPTVPAEFSQRPFVRGIVGAARRGNDINSATSQFFICLDDRPEWNGEYTVFGEVYRGITTVEIISNVPTEEGNGQKMREKVVIYRVHLEKAGDSRRTAQ